MTRPLRAQRAGIGTEWAYPLVSLAGRREPELPLLPIGVLAGGGPLLNSGVVRRAESMRDLSHMCALRGVFIPARAGARGWRGLS